MIIMLTYAFFPAQHFLGSPGTFFTQLTVILCWIIETIFLSLIIDLEQTKFRK
jgi:hypothetical protein